MLTRRRLIQSGLTTAAAVSFGPAFWRDAFAAPPERAPVGPVRAAAAAGRQRACSCPPGFTSRVIARVDQLDPGHRLRLPDLPRRRGDVTDARRRLDPGRQLRGPGRPGGASAIRFDAAGEHHRRLPDPRRHEHELRRRPDAVGHVAVVRGGRRRPGLGVRPDRRTPAVARPAMGVLPARGRVRGPGRRAGLPQRGRRRRRLLPLHARPTIRISPPALLEIACAGVGEQVDWKTVPTRPAVPGAARHAQQVAGLDQVPRAARASGSTAASSTS